MAVPARTSRPTPVPHPERIEVGWMLAGPLDDVDVQAVQQARHRVLEFLREEFAQYDWRMPVVWRKELALEPRVEPVTLLDAGVAEREAKAWDFALVVTAADLRSYFKPFALGTPAQSVDTAVLSTARLDPVATSSAADEEERVDVLAQRLFALALHSFGHLNDLPHTDDPYDLMYDLGTVRDLDAMCRLEDDVADRMVDELRAVADLRLEEQRQRPRHHVRFFLRATWINRRDILSSIVRTRPWALPLRLSRLSTAAISTMLLLVMTAEVWELGMSQPLALVAGLAVAALAGTTIFLLERQQLLRRRRTARPSEQRVVTHVAIVLSVVLGMATTYGLLFTTVLGFALSLFDAALVRGWAASLDHPVSLANYMALAGFIATVGLVIGALGASFEEQTYFRHVAFIDEET